jgi:hypothetical protein
MRATRPATGSCPRTPAFGWRRCSTSTCWAPAPRRPRRPPVACRPHPGAGTDVDVDRPVDDVGRLADTDILGCDVGAARSDISGTRARGAGTSASAAAPRHELEQRVVRLQRRASETERARRRPVDGGRGESQPQKRDHQEVLAHDDFLRVPSSRVAFRQTPRRRAERTAASSNRAISWAIGDSPESRRGFSLNQVRHAAGSAEPPE